MIPRSPRAPNVVLIVLDDLGFADLGCYGSAVATPHIDGLAERGLRYNNFHVTPLCGPTRACLMTGRNHHKVGMGFLVDFSSPQPGYTARIPKSAGTLPHLLRGAGYNTFAVGKWHLTPRDECGPAGPFSRWPLGAGFERFYGFLHGMADEYLPVLVRDNTFIEPPFSPEEGYHLTEDLASQAIRLVQDQQQAMPDKPFFLYFAPGAVHCPHQVPPEWTERYRGKFDAGWDVEREERLARQRDLGVVPAGATLTPRPSWVSPWAELSSDAQRVFARQMEVYAGFLTHADAQIGRVLDFLAAAEALDDTIVMVVSDNGAAGGVDQGSFDLMTGTDDVSSMLERIDDFGGVESMSTYATGWALAGNTPLRLWKSYTWLGGVRVPLVVHWPAGIDRSGAGEVRSQFGHAIDVMPTILDASGTEPPAQIDGVTQQPFDGKSLLPTFADPGAPSPRSTQYFEMLGSRSIYHDGWKATTDHVPGADMPWSDEGSRDFESDRWSLFHLDTDFSEADDVSAENPERLRQLTELWWHEAGRNNVLPLLDSFTQRPQEETEPANGERTRFLCFAGAGPVETPSPFPAGFTFTAEIEVPEQSEPTGVVCAQHLRVSSSYTPAVWACYLLHGRPVVTFNLTSAPQRIPIDEPLPAGRCELTVTYAPAGEGAGSAVVSIDDREATSAAVDLPPAADTVGNVLGGGSLPGTLLIGRDWGRAACDDYRSPFPFTGRIHRAVFQLHAS